MRGICVKLVGNKKREEFNPEKIKKVYISGGRMGDIIVKTPMLEALSKLNSDLKIDIEVIKGGESLVENIPYINEVIIGDSYTKKNRISRIIDSLAFSIKNRKKYDLYFDFTNNCRFLHILSLKILASKYLIGPHRLEKFKIKKDELTIFDRYVEIDKDAHAVDINMDFLEPLGLKEESKKYKLYLGQNEEKFKDYFDKNRINIVVNHRASTEKRSFNYDELKEILIKLSKVDSKVSVYLATMPNEYKTLKNIVDELKIEKVHLLMKTDTVGEFAGIIKYCDIVVSVDTGVIHIASVYDKPIVGVYPLSENSYKLFAPRSSKYEIVRGKKDGYTIEGFSIDEIIDKTRKIIIEKSEV